jgi:hypothetical protein
VEGRSQPQDRPADGGDGPMTFQSLAELRLYVAKQAVEAHEWGSYDLKRAQEVVEARRERSRALRRERQAKYRASRRRKRLADGSD